jgi:hypothetical protein
MSHLPPHLLRKRTTEIERLIYFGTPPRERRDTVRKMIRARLRDGWLNSNTSIAIWVWDDLQKRRPSRMVA